MQSRQYASPNVSLKGDIYYLRRSKGTHTRARTRNTAYCLGYRTLNINLKPYRCASYVVTCKGVEYFGLVVTVCSV